VKFLILLLEILQGPQFWVKTPIRKNNCSSLIITDVEFRFAPCVVDLIKKWGVKDPKKREHYLIFINSGVKKFILNNTPEKIKIDV
jgi:hypothetical protein